MTLLDNAQIHKLAVIARELEAYRQSPALTRVPETAVEAHAVTDIIAEVASAVTELERSRKVLTEPFNVKVKSINALYKLLTEPFGEVRTTADKLVLAHNQAERARVQREKDEAERKAREAAEAEALAVAKAQEAESEPARAEALAEAEVASTAIARAQATQIMEAPRAYRSEIGTVGIRKTFKLDTFDPNAIPDEFWLRPSVLEAVRKELAKAVRAGMHNITGTVVVEDESTTARR